MAEARISWLSLNEPSPLLHVGQSNSRNLPLLWQWSEYAPPACRRLPSILISVLQMTHLPPWASNIVLSASSGWPPRRRRYGRSLSHRLMASFAHALHRHPRPFGPRFSNTKSVSGFRVAQVRQSRPSAVINSGFAFMGFFSRHFLYAASFRALIRSGFLAAHSLAARDWQNLHLYARPLLRQLAFPNCSSGLSSWHPGQ